MVQAISSINSNVDSEYLRILQELMQLGITPSGNKSVDKAKLAEAKQKLIKKIQEKEQNAQNAQFNIDKDTNNTVQNDERAKMEEEKLGAKTVGELNRIYFGI